MGDLKYVVSSCSGPMSLSTKGWEVEDYNNSTISPVKREENAIRSWHKGQGPSTSSMIRREHEREKRKRERETSWFC